MKLNFSDTQLYNKAGYVIVRVDDTPVSLHVGGECGESIGSIEMTAAEYAKKEGLKKLEHMCDESWSTQCGLSVIRRTYHSERYPLTDRGKSQAVARRRREREKERT